MKRELTEAARANGQGRLATHASLLWIRLQEHTWLEAPAASLMPGARLQAILGVPFSLEPLSN